MRTIARAAVVVFGAAGIALSAAGTASADHDRGDGLLACNYYEICFSQHSNSSGGQRHFYESWYKHAEQGNFSNGVRFWHNASSIKNRDSSANVCVKESGDWTNDTWWFDNDHVNHNFVYDLNDENNAHWRVSGGC